MASVSYSFPQKVAALGPGQKGIASLSHAGRTFRFRTNPNQFVWSYQLNKRIDQTYGGRVVQLLGTKIEDFSLKADSGLGGWDYFNRMAKFLRDVMVEQRDGSPATFEYTQRGWKFNCYIVSVPFEDSVEQVLREFEITMKVQEDISGVMSKNSLSAELNRLTDGVGFRRSKYNDPQKGDETLADVIGDNLGAIPVDQIANSLAGIFQPGTTSQFLPNGLPNLGTVLNIGK
jgi:hypothetical protein